MFALQVQLVLPLKYKFMEHNMSIYVILHIYAVVFTMSMITTFHIFLLSIFRSRSLSTTCVMIPFDGEYQHL